MVITTTKTGKGIFNKTRKSIVIGNYKACKGVLSQAKGLMFTRRRQRGLIFIFNKENNVSLHMFFVFYPIDVLFLSSDKKVVEIKENFRPFTFYFPRRKSRFVIELPEGTIKKSKTSVGDTISF